MHIDMRVQHARSACAFSMPMRDALPFAAALAQMVRVLPTKPLHVVVLGPRRDGPRGDKGSASFELSMRPSEQACAPKQATVAPRAAIEDLHEVRACTPCICPHSRMPKQRARPCGIGDGVLLSASVDPPRWPLSSVRPNRHGSKHLTSSRLAPWSLGTISPHACHPSAARVLFDPRDTGRRAPRLGA